MSSNILNKIIDKFDNDKIVKFSQVDPFKDVTTWISTGSPTLDIHLNTMGYPSGIIEIRGPSQSGKTTMALMAIREAQRANPDAIIVILSSERRDNKHYAQRIGVKTDNVLLYKVRDIEMVYRRIKQTVDKGEEIWAEEKLQGKPKFIFLWDSLGGTVSGQEKEKMDENAKKDKQDHAAMMSAARANKGGMRYIVSEVYDKDITLIIINHTYDGDNNTKKSYGGTGIEYMPTMRLDIKKAFQNGDVKVGEEKVGQNTTVTPFKNDFSNTKKPIEVEIKFGNGIVLSPLDIQFGIERGVLEKHGFGASFMKGKLKWKSRGELYQLYDSNNPLLKVLTSKLIKEAHKVVLEKRKKEELLFQKNLGGDDE